MHVNPVRHAAVEFSRHIMGIAGEGLGWFLKCGAWVPRTDTVRFEGQVNIYLQRGVSGVTGW